MVRKIVSFLLLGCLLACLALPAAAKTDAVTPYIQRMISYYLYYQENAEREIDVLVNHIAAMDPEKGELWRNIMDSWSWVNAEMETPAGILPDGLPEDDSLCIVVLGYDLNDNGSMKPELVQRLEVAKASAEKYPNAYIAVTGGETSEVSGISEAGEMYNWLRSNGIARERIIQEKASYTTTDNARKVAALLENSYPGIESVALITSDYHIHWSAALFAAALHMEGDQQSLVGCAVNETGKQMDTLYTQAWGICEITGVPFAEATTAPAVLPQDPLEIPLPVPEETVTETEPTVSRTEAAQLPEAEEPQEEAGGFGFLLILVPFAAGLYVLTPKKPRTKRQKPQWSREE